MGSPLQTPVSQPASQPPATAVFQLPGAPEMQREPRREALQACVREQRALSVPKKKPGGDFHPIGPNATATGRPCLGLWKEPRDGPLHGSTERTLCYDNYGVLSPTGPEHPSVLPQGRGTETDRRMENKEKRREQESGKKENNERSRMKQENTRRNTLKMRENMFMLTLGKGKEI